MKSVSSLHISAQYIIVTRSLKVKLGGGCISSKSIFCLGMRANGQNSIGIIKSPSTPAAADVARVPHAKKPQQQEILGCRRRRVLVYILKL
jgi:hypothetical protein